MSTKKEFEAESELQLKEPKKFKVLLLNDDYTSMDFVIDVLITIFHKSYTEAEQIMLEVHHNQKAVCGVYSFEIAETKVTQVEEFARKNEFPLKAVMEEE